MLITDKIKEWLDSNGYDYDNEDVDQIANELGDIAEDDLNDAIAQLIDDDDTVTEHHAEVKNVDGLEIEGEDKDGDGDLDKVTLEKVEPVDNGLSGETTPEEDLMLKLASRKDKPHDSRLAGETTPEEDLMLKLAKSSKSNSLSGETTPEEDNMTNMFAKILADRRW